jgi:hypothetical protein
MALLRVKVGMVKTSWFKRPLWLNVVNETEYRLSFRPPKENNILPVIESAKPERVLIDGSAYRGHLHLGICLCYSSLDEVLKAIDSLSKAGVLEGVPDMRKAILRNIGGVLPGDIPKGLLGFLSPRVPSFTLESPEKQNYIDGVALLDPRQRGKWLLRFGELPIGELKKAVLLSYILDGWRKDWRKEEKKQWLIKNGYSEAELKARKIAHELLGDNDRHLLRLRLPREEAEERQNRAGIPLRCPPDGCELPEQEVRNRRLRRGLRGRRGTPSTDSAQVLPQGLR